MSKKPTTKPITIESTTYINVKGFNLVISKGDEKIHVFYPSRDLPIDLKAIGYNDSYTIVKKSTSNNYIGIPITLLHKLYSAS